MTDEQFEFVLAVDTYKRLNNRPFPTWTEILEVVKQLGYRKVAASELTLSKAVGPVEYADFKSADEHDSAAGVWLPARINRLPKFLPMHYDAWEGVPMSHTVVSPSLSRCLSWPHSTNPSATRLKPHPRSAGVAELLLRCGFRPVCGAV